MYMFFIYSLQLVVTNHVTCLDNVAVETILPSVMVSLTYKLS